MNAPFQTLPPFVQALDVRARCAPLLRAPTTMPVAEWAEANRELNNLGAYKGPWRNENSPYLVEPMNAATDPEVREVVFVGSSQSAKTELILNLMGFFATAYPRDQLCVQPTQSLCDDFSERRLGKSLIGDSPKIGALVAPTRSDDKKRHKNFTTGASITLAWPSPSELASRPVPVCYLDELDRMKANIQGEGDPRELLKNRMTTFRRPLLVGVSSPSRDFHSGIVGWWHEGTRCLLAWQCLQCGEYWTPGFDFNRRPTTAHLVWPKGARPQEAFEAVTCVCPLCGGVHQGDRDKRELLSTGTWLGEGESITSDGERLGARRKVKTASFWLSGIAAAFKPWGELAQDFVAAHNHYKETEEEERLTTVYNTGFGYPYKAKSSAMPVELEEIAKHRRPYRFGEVPAGVEFLIAAVDPGGHKFDVAVWGFDFERRGWLIDRYTKTTRADGETQLDPANAAEDWDEIVSPLFEKSYPLVDAPGWSLPVGVVAIDTGGAAGRNEETGETTSGVIDEARSFARRLRARGVPSWRMVLVKGASPRTASILPQSPTHERDGNGKRRPDSVPIYVIGVHALKNIAAVRVHIPIEHEEPLPGLIRYAADTTDQHLKEIAQGEEKIRGEWVRKGPNETLDLYCYAEAVRVKLRVDKMDRKSRPVWAARHKTAYPPFKLVPLPDATSPTSSRRRPRGRRILSRGLAA